MDLEKAWKDMENERPATFDEVDTHMLEKYKSNSPLKKIEKSLKLNIAYSIPICLFMLAIIYWYHFWLLRLIMLVLLLFSAVVVISALRLLKSIAGAGFTKENLVGELEFHYNSVSLWIRNQEIWGAFLYPVSITGGFMYGGTVGSGKSIPELMTKPLILISLAVCWLLLTPLCIWLVRKMFHISFGKYLEQVKANIDELRAQ